ncbi:CDK5 and ABL1 enzyme substrate 2,CDK5 and ABL1 enzyme substrate 1 [Lepeophtheirus salmonis]|uniref:CDK5 and ABL1 enzyme substrate 2,CDK5 and ABL1 enzyme substrate 1 n=1 Tax=Lepeophtheirus salmonis TaxID=72036 RepID=A0A7R8D130_LEPSM|nr:CDK5 and ABL1 enzyme substrate 2,CDK5 and ABL1 enzyme substrate 1 [Lepeophtheirus salmonis]CAF2946877.1 CDK5 and ABL1 enzyme substrate 2,CDK5 and ABL1 enzyme substrate 1 [Lepeophtheirus salmonis]
MNFKPRNRREGNLDLNRRRVAAISFLSNISTSNANSSIALDCLVGTNVLRDFVKNKRRLARPLASVDRDTLLPIKLQVENHKPQQFSKKQLKMKQTPLFVSQLLPLTQGFANFRKQGTQILYFVTPPTINNVARISHGLHFYDESESTNAQFLISRTLRSSCESLILPNILGSRFRKISGNISESSTTINKEIKIFRPRDDSPEMRGFFEDRMVVVEREKKVPIAIFSTIAFQRSLTSRATNYYRGDHSSRKHRTSGTVPRPLSSINDIKDTLDLICHDKTEEAQETSYCHLLYSSSSVRWSASIDELQEFSSVTINNKTLPRYPSNDVRNISPTGIITYNSETDALCSTYHPHALDGWLIAGKYRTHLPFQSYITSVIEYVKPSEIKKELNEKFKEKFPQLQLTLSKLRSLKREILKIAHGECKMDSLTIAMSYVYFEILVLKNAITKINRKLCAGACLLLAAKLNDVKGPMLKNLIEKIEGGFRISRKELISSEFSVLVALEFGLHFLGGRGTRYLHNYQRMCILNNSKMRTVRILKEYKNNFLHGKTNQLFFYNNHTKDNRLKDGTANSTPSDSTCDSHFHKFHSRFRGSISSKRSQSCFQSIYHFMVAKSVTEFKAISAYQVYW